MATTAPEISVLARDRAFESLYRQYVKDVYHYALALLRNAADAEDVTQTTFLNAYRAYARGVEVEKPQNWLIKIAHNVARTRYARASRRVKEVPLEDHVEQLAVPEESRPDVQVVLEALGLLPFNQRAAIVMRELEGRSYAEIADALDVSVSAVETLIFRARRSLRVKASAVRSLAAVPLPSSLAGLFEAGGGLIAGGGVAGGGLAAGGLIGKAAIAIVVGVIATSVSSDRTGPATAARDSASRPSAAHSWSRTQSPKTTAQTMQGEEARSGSPISVDDAVAEAHFSTGISPPSTGMTPGGGVTAPLPNVAHPSVPTSNLETVAAAGQPVVSTAEQTIADAQTAVPLPLPQAPSLPSVPVPTPPVPPLPGGTPLP